MVYFGVLWGILMLWEWVWWVYRFNEFCRDTHGFSGCICVILWVVFCLLGLFFVAPVLCHSLVQWAEWSFVIHLYLVAGGNNNIKMRIVNQFLNNNMHFLNVCYCLIWLHVLISYCFALKSHSLPLKTFYQINRTRKESHRESLTNFAISKQFGFSYFIREW